MDNETDSLILFKSRDSKWLYKEIVGHERSSLDTII